MSILRDHRPGEAPCVPCWTGECLTCGGPIRVRWENDWADSQSCTLTEFLSDNDESLSYHAGDRVKLLALKPGEQVTVMGGACNVRRMEGES